MIVEACIAPLSAPLMLVIPATFRAVLGIRLQSAGVLVMAFGHLWGSASRELRQRLQMRSASALEHSVDRVANVALLLYTLLLLVALLRSLVPEPLAEHLDIRRFPGSVRFQGRHASHCSLAALPQPA